MPRSLRYLSYSTERWGRGSDDDVVTRTGLWKKVFGMCEHLVQQKDSLTQLDLDLGGLSHVEIYEEEEAQGFGFRLGHLTSLTEFTLKNQFPDEPENARMLLDRLPCSLRRLNICDFPYDADGEAMVVAAQYYLTEDLSTNIGFQKSALALAVDDRRIRTSKLLPNLKEFAVSFSDHNDPGAISRRLRDCFEYVGDRYRRELGWRFVVNRITKMRGAVPPYLWDEHVVDFVKVYDNMANDNLWDRKSDYEIKEEEECKRLEEIERRKRAAREEGERFEAEEARRLGLSESLTPPSPPPSISPVSGSLSRSVATAGPANMAVVAAAMTMANANEGLT